MVKAIKISAKDLKYSMDQLLSNLGAIHKDRAYTGYVFFAESDLKQLRRNFRRNLRAENPKAKKYVIDGLVDQHFYQFATNMSLESVIQPGYVLVDFDGIGSSVRKLEEFEQRAEAAKADLERRRLVEEALQRAAAKEARYDHKFLPRGLVKFFVDNFGEPTRS